MNPRAFVKSIATALSFTLRNTFPGLVLASQSR